MTDDTLAASLAGLANMAGTATGRRCLAGRILDEVSPTNRATILDYLHTRPGTPGHVSRTALARMLRAGGRPVSASQLTNHHTGTCICDNPTDGQEVAA